MKKITHISGPSIPLNMKDVDTDLIIPAQFLTQVTKQGYGQALFRRLCDSNPNFVFNQPQFRHGKILIAGDNFGCGSSREHAVWALMEWGIEAIISTSFSDIFYNNSAKNGLLLIVQPQKIVHKLMLHAERGNYKLTIDVAHQIISTPDHEKHPFEIEPFRKYCFTQGHDELDYILSHMKEIENFGIKQRERVYSPIFSTLHGIHD
jgi:3-isopropylmalate/(R)-2-methylmalate dehydratase small subunit